MPTRDNLAVNLFDRQAHSGRRGKGAGDKPPCRFFAVVLRHHPMNLADIDGWEKVREKIDLPLGQNLADWVLARHIFFDGDRMDDETKGVVGHL